MRADLTELIRDARAMRERAAAEREDAIILREAATTLRKMAKDVREQIRRQLVPPAGQSSDEGDGSFRSARSESR